MSAAAVPVRAAGQDRKGAAAGPGGGPGGAPTAQKA